MPFFLFEGFVEQILWSFVNFSTAPILKSELFELSTNIFSFGTWVVFDWLAEYRLDLSPKFQPSNKSESCLVAFATRIHGFFICLSSFLIYLTDR